MINAIKRLSKEKIFNIIIITLLMILLVILDNCGNTAISAEDAVTKYLDGLKEDFNIKEMKKYIYDDKIFCFSRFGNDAEFYEGLLDVLKPQANKIKYDIYDVEDIDEEEFDCVQFDKVKSDGVQFDDIKKVCVKMTYIDAKKAFSKATNESNFNINSSSYKKEEFYKSLEKLLADKNNFSYTESDVYFYVGESMLFTKGGYDPVCEIIAIENIGDVFYCNYATYVEETIDANYRHKVGEWYKYGF